MWFTCYEYNQITDIQSTFSVAFDIMCSNRAVDIVSSLRAERPRNRGPMPSLATNFPFL
jgi:hypothetical protein